MTPVRITMHDFKGELSRFFSRYPSDLALFRPDQLPVNILEPQGHVRTYYQGLFSVVQRYFNLRPETWSELPGIVLRLLRSRRPDDPPPSLVDLERALRKAARTENRPNLLTAARAIAAIIEILGRTARIRKVREHE